MEEGVTLGRLGGLGHTHILYIESQFMENKA